MRKLFSVFAAGLLVLGVAGQAGASNLPFTANFSFGVGTLPSLSVPGSGTAFVNGSGIGLHVTSFNLAGGTFLTQASTVVPNAAPISGLLFAGGAYSIHLAVPKSAAVLIPTGSVSNAPGAFGGLSAGGGGGVMPINGVAVVCLFDACSGAPSANLAVPLTPVGQGGTVFAQGAVNITAIGAPWVGGTAAVGTVTAMGFAHGPLTGVTTTAQPSGVVSLVVPVFVSTSLPTFPVVPVFSRLTLHFIPEPGTLLLLGSGIAGLALVGRRRMQK
jgi:hypothetical protein